MNAKRKQSEETARDGNLRVRLTKLPSNTKERIEVILSEFNMEPQQFSQLFEEIESKLSQYKEGFEKTHIDLFGKEKPNAQQRKMSTKLIEQLRNNLDPFISAFEKDEYLSVGANLALERLEEAGLFMQDPAVGYEFPRELRIQYRTGTQRLKVDSSDEDFVFKYPVKAIARLYYICCYALEKQNFMNANGRPSKSKYEPILINMLIPPYCKATQQQPTTDPEGAFERFVVRILKDTTNSYTEEMYSKGRGGDPEILRKQIAQTIALYTMKSPE